MKLFLIAEYQNGRSFAATEYKSLKRFSATEFKMLQDSVSLYMKITTAIGAFSALVGLCGLFKTNTVSLGEMNLGPQGFRKDANRAGMFMTGLLSVCMLLLAPIMGAKRILKLIDPIISLLRQVPYATWMISVFDKWWNDQYDFDDLPQDIKEFNDQRMRMDDDDILVDAVEDLGEVNQRMRKAYAQAEKSDVKGKPENISEVKQENVSHSRFYTDQQKEQAAKAKPVRPTPVKGWEDVLDNKIYKNEQKTKRTKEDILKCNERMSDKDNLAYFIEFNRNIDNPMYMIRYGIKLNKAVCIPQEAMRDWLYAMWSQKSGRVKYEGIVYTSLLSLFTALGIEVIDVSSASSMDEADYSSDDFGPDPLPKAQTINLAVAQEIAKDVEKVKEEEASRISLENLAAEEGMTSYPSKPDHLKLETQGWYEDFQEWMNFPPEEGKRPDCFGRERNSVEHTDTWYSWIYQEIINTPKELRQFFFPKQEETLYTAKVMHGSLWAPSTWTPRKHITESVDPNGLWTTFVAYIKVNGKVLLKGLALCVLIRMLVEYIKTAPQEDVFLNASPQGQNRGRKRGGESKGKQGKRRFVVPSGGADAQDDYNHYEEPHYEEHDNEDIARIDANDFDARFDPFVSTVGKHKEKTMKQYENTQHGSHSKYRSKFKDDEDQTPSRKLKGQAKLKPIVLPAILGEGVTRNKIRKSKQPLQAKAKDIIQFVDAAKRAQSMKLKPQAFNTNQLAAGIYKFYRFIEGQYKYCCTGTHVGNKMWVVLHCMSEDITASYRAVNHVATFDFTGVEMMVFGDQLACFPVSGYASPFKGSSLKVLEDAGIVTVFGYGNGQTNTPDSVIGFASPEGWCNAKTRDGDCTSPVLNENGQIVGFWTHGDGKLFGRFEKVTPELIEFAKTGSSKLHVGLDFQLRPPSL